MKSAGIGRVQLGGNLGFLTARENCYPAVISVN
jgi:hypothetical protein